MNGISMLILSVGGIITVLFFVTYAAQKHDLNGIKDKTVGNGQHGTARWATRQEVKRTYHHVPYTPNQWRQAAKEGKQPTANGKPLPQGIVLGCQGGRKTTALVDSDDVHGETAPIFFRGLAAVWITHRVRSAAVILGMSMAT